MRKALELLVPIVVLLVIWLLLVSDTLPTSLPKPFTEILPTLPIYALVMFGAYSLGSIGISLVRFRECPEAYVALKKEIEEAKADLKSKGLEL